MIKNINDTIAINVLTYLLAGSGAYSILDLCGSMYMMSLGCK